MDFLFQRFLRLSINSNDRPRYIRYFQNEYARIDRANVFDETPGYQITLHIVDEIPDDLPADAIRNRRRFKNLFTFDYAFHGAGTKDVHLYFKDHPVSRLYVTAVGVFVQAQLLEPLMYLSLLKQGVLLMHSAGVAKDGKAYLFPAQGGTGKTTTSMRLLSDGYEFLGDDLILVDPEEGLAYPYARPLHIFTYNVRNLHGARVPLSVQAAIYFKNVLRFVLERILRNEFLISTRVHADEILDNFRFSDPARLHNVIFLIREGESRSVALETNAVKTEVAETIVDSADLNESLFGLLADPKQQQKIRKSEIDVTKRILKKSDYFGYLNTRKINLQNVARYLENVETKTDDSAKRNV